MMQRLGIVLTLWCMVLNGLCAVGDMTLAPGPVGSLVVPAVRNYAPRYSPDGKWIAFLRGTDPQADTELWVMDAEGKNARALLTRETMRYALTLHDMDIHGAQAATGEPQIPDTAPRPPQAPFVRHYTWHPTSGSLICQVSSEHGRGGVYQVMPDGSFRQVPHPLGFLYSLPPVSWGNFLLSPDGTEIAFVGGSGLFPDDSGFFRASLDDRESSEMKWKIGYTCYEAAWGIDGRIYGAMAPLSAKNKEDIAADIYAIAPDGVMTRIVNTPEADERSPSLSPDGKWLAYVRNGILIARELATGTENTELTGLNQATAYRWLPTGYLLATTSGVLPVDWRSDPMTPQDLQEDIVVISPRGGTPELRILYRTSAVSRMAPGELPNFRDGSVVVDLMEMRLSLRDTDRLPGFLQTLPDISPDGTRMVYEWEGALYLLEIPKLKQPAMSMSALDH